ncbi:universal stress protein [Halorussus halobius]|uniref:universal stress protein n=1 Tax=Halorussus halobius TaxID=1710537 RepID=UPI001092BAD3|nr:universal stress protein [Halorussus halobius]
MFEEILLPVDGSEGTDEAVAHALDVAERFDATASVVHVADTNRDSVTVVGTEVVDALEREGEEIVESTAETARRRGVDVRTEVVQGDPASAIAEYAAERGMDLVAMPTHGRSTIGEYVLGSVTERVVRLAEVPVLTVRTRGEARTAFPYESVLVATDGSEAARAATDRGVELAAALDAAVQAVSVVDDASLGPDVRSEAASRKLDGDATEAASAAADRAREAGVEDVAETVRHGDVHGEILAAVEETDADAVVLGTSGRGGVDRVLLGSVAERVVRTSPVPVLTVPR